MKKFFKKFAEMKNEGFTLIELLMVVLLIGILSAIGITQFVNFAADAKNATTKANLQVLRNAIANQNGQMRIRCNVSSASFPALANLIMNDITQGASPCTTTQVASSADRNFVANNIPSNPWSNSTAVNTVNPGTLDANGGSTGATTITTPAANNVQDCTLSTAACEANRATHNCTGVAYSGTDNGWCYNPSTGNIWPNTSNNSGTAGTGVENQY